MKKLESEKARVDLELNLLEYQRDEYFINLEEKSNIKKKIFKNITSPVIGAIITGVIAFIMNNGVLPIEVTEIIMIMTTIVEVIALRVTVDDLADYSKLKRLTEEVCLEELNLKIEDKKQEKEKLLANEKTNVETLSYDNVLEENSNNITKETTKVLCKRMNEGSKKEK